MYENLTAITNTVVVSTLTFHSMTSFMHQQKLLLSLLQMLESEIKHQQYSSHGIRKYSSTSYIGMTRKKMTANRKGKH